jgi:peptide/nickel transport system ATP-binding protein
VTAGSPASPDSAAAAGPVAVPGPMAAPGAAGPDPAPGTLGPEAGNGEVLLRAEHITKYFPIRKGILLQREIARVHAVDDVSFELRAGETLGLVGESGCGKSTLARCIARLFPLTSGSVVFEGRDISRLTRRQLRPVRRDLQMVFQDPYASLNPRKRVGTVIADPMRIHRWGSRDQIKRRVGELLELVGLSPEHVNRYPHEFSGGQRQRIGVARALALHPRLIIADEPVSALDVSIRAQVINLLDDLQDELSLTYIFIAHDLGVVRHVSDRIAVMYLGKIVEISPAEDLYRRPIHPYTEALLSAVPIPDPDLSEQRAQIVLEGDVPSPIAPPGGCRFHTRCRYATEICGQAEPPLVPHSSDGHMAACHHPLNADRPATADPRP